MRFIVMTEHPRTPEHAGTRAIHTTMETIVQTGAVHKHQNSGCHPDSLQVRPRVLEAPPPNTIHSLVLQCLTQVRSRAQFVCSPHPLEEPPPRKHQQKSWAPRPNSLQGLFIDVDACSHKSGPTHQGKQHGNRNFMFFVVRWRFKHKLQAAPAHLHAFAQLAHCLLTKTLEKGQITSERHCANGHAYVPQLAPLAAQLGHRRPRQAEAAATMGAGSELVEESIASARALSGNLP